MTKEQIHSNYLERIQAEHGNKESRPPEEASALVIGGSTEGSIGTEIADHLKHLFRHVDAPDKSIIDVRWPKDMRDWLDSQPPYDALVLSHGVTNMDWFEDQPWERMHETAEVNFIGTAYMIREFVRATIKQPFQKRIVVIGSMAYRSVLNASAMYCASKAAVAHLVRCLGWELTPKGYRIFGVHPSNTEGTPMTERTIDEIQRYRGFATRDQAEAYWGSINLMPEWLSAQEIAECVEFLLTSQIASGYMTGTNIELSGGQR